MVVSIASSPANQQRPAPSAAAPTIVSSAATSFVRSKEIVCHKCHGRGHVAAQCPSTRTMIVNENGEWESKSDREEEGPKYDEDHESNDNEIQPDEGDNNYFISLYVLSVTATKEDNRQQHNLFYTRGMIKEKLCRIIIDNGSCNNIISQELVDRIELKQRCHPNPYKMCMVCCV